MNVRQLKKEPGSVCTVTRTCTWTWINCIINLLLTAITRQDNCWQNNKWLAGNLFNNNRALYRVYPGRILVHIGFFRHPCNRYTFNLQIRKLDCLHNTYLSMWCPTTLSLKQLHTSNRKTGCKRSLYYVHVHEVFMLYTTYSNSSR